MNVIEITWTLMVGAWTFKELELYEAPCPDFVGVSIKEYYAALPDGSELPYWLSFSNSPVGLRASYIAVPGNYEIIVRFIYENG